MKIGKKIISLFYESATKRRRRHIRELDKIFGNTVAYGPLKGFKLGKPSRSGSDGASMLLGLYELEVQQLMEKESANHDVLLALGAADGYFGLGALVNNLFSKSYCFEMQEKSQIALLENAKFNGLQDRVTILGIAEKNFYEQIPADELKRSFVVVDIEGGEFTILDASTFSAMANSLFVIELHEHTPDTQEKVEALCQMADLTHTATFMSTGARDLSNIPEVRNYRDTDRWLMCSESRPYLMRWLVLRPRN